GADHDHGRDSLALQSPENCPAVDEGQADVEEDDIERGRLQLACPGRPIAGGMHLVPVPPEDRSNRVAKSAVVFDDQDPAHAGLGASGSVNRNVAPGRLPSSTATVPAGASTRPLTIARPSPVPPPFPVLSPRKNRSKIRSRVSAGTPGPRSTTRTVTRPGSSFVTAIVIGVP